MGPFVWAGFWHLFGGHDPADGRKLSEILCMKIYCAPKWISMISLNTSMTIPGFMSGKSGIANKAYAAAVDT